MVGAPGGLGRGLANLIPQKTQVGEEGQEVRLIPVDMINPNPNQPRFEFSQEALEDLSQSIKRQGVLQPILVRRLASGGYELVAGERRLRASKLAGLKTIPALVREMDEEESLAIALIENLQREDLNPMEEAKGLQKLQEVFGLSQEDLANRVGKSRPAVANALRLLALPEPLQDALSRSLISAGHARALLMVADPAARQELYERLRAQSMSVRQAEAEASYFKEHGVLPEQGQAVQSGTEAASAGESKASPRKSRAAADDFLVAVRERISSGLRARVELKGNRDKGQLLFRYGSQEELDEILARLGVPSGE